MDKSHPINNMSISFNLLARGQELSTQAVHEAFYIGSTTMYLILFNHRVVSFMVSIEF